MHTAAVRDLRMTEGSEREARITARTAALLYDVLRYLGDVGRARVAVLGDRAVCEADDDLFTALPEFTWRQGRSWRDRFVACFDRLAERLAQGRAPLPETPAEEFALRLAILQAALLIAVQPELVRRTVYDTPSDEGDFDWQWCRARLFRHGYLPLFSDAGFAGLEDPGDQANRRLRIGDYRPDSWFQGFEDD